MCIHRYSPEILTLWDEVQECRHFGKCPGLEVCGPWAALERHSLSHVDKAFVYAPPHLCGALRHLLGLCPPKCHSTQHTDGTSALSKVPPGLVQHSPAWSHLGALSHLQPSWKEAAMPPLCWMPLLCQTCRAAWARGSSGCQHRRTRF